MCSCPQSKQVSASASRSILNYRLTCGFFASVFRQPVPKKDKGRAPGGMWLCEPGKPACRYARPVPRAAAFEKNAPDLIRRRYSVQQHFRSFGSGRSGTFMQHLQGAFRSGRPARLVYGAANARCWLNSARKARKAEPNREQQWLVPSPDADIAAHAVLFRPPGDGPFPLALIAHASTQNALRRAQMPQPEYPALAALAGRARLCRAGAGTAGPWRDRREISRGSGRLRRRQLFPRRPCDRGFDQGGAGFLRSSLYPAGRRGRRSGIPPAAGARWRWRAKTPRQSRPSLSSRRAAAAMPTISGTRSARRMRWSRRRPSSARRRGCR